MKYRSLLILGTLLLVACSSNEIPMDQINPSGMHGDSRGFLPGMNVDLASLPEAKPSEIIDIEDGEIIELNPMLIRKKIGDTEFAMYGYNGQFPGPTLKAKQGSTFTVNVKNMIDQPTTVHWHGIRLQNKFDGADGVTQKAIEPGDSFTYTVTVPDEGIFWYHPHVREDIQQDMGLYGLLHVTSNDTDAYPPVDREVYLAVDDLQIDAEGNPTPFGSTDASQALMGRFGNAYLVNGTPILLGSDQDPPPSMQVRSGEVVRFHVLNAANTRTFNLAYTIPERMKILGKDQGRAERAEFVDHIILAPSERATIDIAFDASPRLVSITHQAPGGRAVDLFQAEILPEKTAQSFSKEFLAVTQYDAVLQNINLLRPFLNKPVDKTLHLTVETGMGHMGHGMMMDHASPDGIEWEDTMAMMNQMSNKSNTQWKLIDEETGKENMDIHWKFKKGDVVKIRVMNDSQEQGSDHAMQHPIHLHGQRFLVLNDNGVENDNFAWKDTVLVPAGHTVDLLVEMSNPGDWMIHCHIAEHLSNGMMGMFTVQ